MACPRRIFITKKNIQLLKFLCYAAKCPFAGYQQYRLYQCYLFAALV